MLRLDCNVLSLTSHATQEEVKIPLSSVFDIFPVTHTEDTAELFLSAPTPHILQILSIVRRPGTIENAKLEIDEHTVMLALSSISECTQLTGRLAEARQQIAIHLLDQCSLVVPPPATVPTLLSSPMQQAPPCGELDIEKAVDVPCEFLGLCLQTAAWGKENDAADAASLINSSELHSYRPCDLHLSTHGLAIKHRIAATKAQLMAGPWSIPWPALVEVRTLDVPVLAERPPKTHPQVVSISIAHRAGLTRSTCCTLNIAVDSLIRTQHLLRVLKACQSQHRSAATSGPEKFTPTTSIATFADEQKGAHPRCPEMNTAPTTNRLSIQTSTLGAGPGSLKDAELHVVYINSIPVSLTPAMAISLKSYRPEDAIMPTPFELSQVHILLPTVSIFQRCSIVVDKLGLNIVPLVPANSERLRQERGRLAARAVPSEGGGVSHYLLLTEGMVFPISSIVDCAEEPAFTPTVPVPGAIATAETPANGGATNGEQTNGQTQVPAPNANGTTGASSRRQVQPFWRSLAPWETKDQGHPQATGEATRGNPPYPHIVGVRVKGALGSGPRGGAEKTPVHMRLNSQPPPPVAIVLSFPEKEKALGFVQAVSGFKKYCLSLAISNYLNTMTKLSQRQTERRNLQCAEEGAVAQRIAQCQATAPPVEPLPLPARPADIPQASRLPRMVTNDEGEVFWYIPRKQANQPSRPQKPNGPTNMTASRPMPQPDPDMASPPPEIGGTGPQTPRRSPSSTQSVSTSVAAPETPKVVKKSHPTGFDDDLGDADTPAPCLASPTPTPGRK